MFDLDRGVLQQMIVRLVELAQAHDVPAAEIATAVGEYVETRDIETRERLEATIDRVLQDTRRRDGVILSRDQVAQLFQMTPQTVSWHIKQGNLQGVKVRVGGRARVGVPLSSVCDYFGVTRERRAALVALLPRDPDGNPEQVFWEASAEELMENVLVADPAKRLDPRAEVQVSLADGKISPDMKTSLDDARKTAEVLNTGMIKKVIS